MFDYRLSVQQELFLIRVEPEKVLIWLGSVKNHTMNLGKAVLSAIRVKNNFNFLLLNLLLQPFRKQVRKNLET